MFIWCLVCLASISIIAFGIDSMGVIGTGLTHIMDAGAILRRTLSRDISAMCPRIIIATCHPDITGYTTTIFIETGTDGTRAVTGTGMIGINVSIGSMRGGVIQKIFTAMDTNHHLTSTES